LENKRGSLTPEIEALGETFLGRKLTLCELRLLPYMDYLSKNFMGVDPRRINQEEREILSGWKKLGFIDYSSSPFNGYFSLRRDFYDFMNNVLWLAYVDNLD
jgi:hypothetical protein